MVEVNINTINKGALPRMFDKALAEILANIADQGTEPEKPREIIIKVRVIPSAKKEGAVSTVEINTKLAPPKVSAGVIAFEWNGEELTALTTEYEQKEIRFAK